MLWVARLVSTQCTHVRWQELPSLQDVGPRNPKAFKDPCRVVVVVPRLVQSLQLAAEEPTSVLASAGAWTIVE